MGVLIDSLKYYSATTERLSGSKVNANKYIHCSAHWNPFAFKTVWLDGKTIKTIYGAVNAVELFGFLNRPCDGWHRAVWNMKGEEA